MEAKMMKKSEKTQNHKNSGQNGKETKNSKPKKVKSVKNLVKTTQNLKNGGDIKMGRNEAEKLLTKVATKLKLQTKRIAAKRESKSGLGALQALHKIGSVKVCVRSNDILAYMPCDKLGYGRPGPGRYVHITVLRAEDPNLEKAFTKALNDPKTKDDWAKEMGFIPRVQKGMATNNLDAIKDRKTKLQDELKALKAAEKKIKAEKKPKTTKAKAITKVATQVA
jgi:hypothetical protein